MNIEATTNDINKTKIINESLQDSTRAIDLLKEQMEKQATPVPKQTLVVENRLASIRRELGSTSDKMLAYKLRRIADSNMLRNVSALSNKTLARKTGTDEERQSHAELRKGPVAENAPLSSRSNSLAAPTYKSTTFQCKSDLDVCLQSSSGALDKALCYALFIRCAVKG